MSEAGLDEAPADVTLLVWGRQNEFAALASLKLVVSMLVSLKDDVSDLKHDMSRLLLPCAKPAHASEVAMTHHDGEGAPGAKAASADASAPGPYQPRLGPRGAGLALAMAGSAVAHTGSRQVATSKPRPASDTTLDVTSQVAQGSAACTGRIRRRIPPRAQACLVADLRAGGGSRSSSDASPATMPATMRRPPTHPCRLARCVLPRFAVLC